MKIKIGAERSRSGVEAGPLQVPSPSNPGKRVLKRRFPQGCNDPGCVRPETRLHRSLLQPTQWSALYTGSSSWHIRASSPRAGTGSLLWPRTNQPPLRRTARALTPTPSAVGHDRATARRNRFPVFEPTTPPILSNECIASSLVW
ncbi:hypothetical protein MRX96_006425 [Rhipicephalus microplus]